MLDLSKLNHNQLAAVQAGMGPMLIVAGAGTGKTRVLTTRIAYLIEQKKIDPHRILAITFTNKAANEMRVRINKMVEHTHIQ
jgi:DNA helicase-2/ATP-dependent DNA helicase PcrA